MWKMNVYQHSLKEDYCFEVHCDFGDWVGTLPWTEKLLVDCNVLLLVLLSLSFSFRVHLIFFLHFFIAFGVFFSHLCVNFTIELLCLRRALANYTKQLDNRRPITSAIATAFDQDKLVKIELTMR